MSERSAYEDPDPIADPAPVEQTWADAGWHESVAELNLAGNLRERRGRR